MPILSEVYRFNEFCQVSKGSFYRNGSQFSNSHEIATSLKQPKQLLTDFKLKTKLRQSKYE